MKAPSLAYARPASLPEVFALLKSSSDARLLAGGQSLIASLNMRLSQPSLLVDVNNIEELAGVSEQQGVIRIGALTRHAALGRLPLIAAKLPLIAKAVPHIAHMAIRNRGTIGGSLALGDPATELPACSLALNATIVAAGEGGERRIPAQDFFKGLFETGLDRLEVLKAVEVPVPPPGSVCGFSEFVRRHGDYAIVGLAAQGLRNGANWTDLRLAYFGVGDRPVLAQSASRMLVAGRDMAEAQAALEDDLHPNEDAENTVATKMHLARVLLARVVESMS